MTSETSYASMVVADLLDTFASNDPVPGGGSAAALTGAIGVSLLIMVAGLPKTKRGTPEEAADLAEASARLRPLRDELMDLVDEDSDAYKEVVSALRLPKGTDAEKQARRTAIDTAMKAATETPLETMRVCQQAMRGATIVAEAGNPNASSDTGVAVELLLAALRGAALNIGVNLKGLGDAGFAARVAEEATQLEADATGDAERARQLLAG